MENAGQSQGEEELRAIAASYRHMAENVPGALLRYRLRPDGTDEVVYMSPRCLDVWEVDAEAILNDANVLWQMIDRDDLPGVRASVMKSAQTLEPWRRQWRITTPSGQRKWLQGVGRPERLADGVVVWNSLILDVSDHRAADEALRIKNAAIESSLNGIALANLDGVLTYVNPAFCRLWGLSEAQALGRHAIDFWQNARRPQEVLAAIAGQGQWTGEMQAVRADGAQLDLQVSASMVSDAEGSPLCMMGSFVDISERKRAESALRELTEQLERRVAARTAELAAANQSLRDVDDFKDKMLANATVGVMAFRASGPCVLTNEAACRIVGATHEQLRSQNFRELASWRRAGLLDMALQVLRDGQAHAAEFEITSSFGVHLWLSCEMSAFVSQGEQHLLLIAHDITRRKQTQAELLHAKDEAEAASRAKSDFLSSMSHELRTPLNAILGFGQLLEIDSAGRLAEQQRGYVSEILRAGRHLLDLINEVLDLARIEAGNLQLSLEPVQVAALLRDCLNLLQPVAREHGVTLDADVPTCDDVWVNADRIRLKQVLLNLLANAIKYNRAGGGVSVGCAADGDALRISVSDEGRGLDRDQLARLFQAFERLGAENTPVEGTGIGLALSKRLVERMRGQLGVDSQVGSGSTFWVRLPRAEPPHVPAAIRRPERRMAVETPAPGQARRTVLYIEDNAVNVLLMESVFAQHLGVQLIAAHQPTLGLDLARTQRPDLILLDIQLPGLDGYEVLRRLRSVEITSAIPVVAISADAMPDSVERGLAAGFLAYLTKPLDIGRLLAIVDDVFRT